MKTIKISVIILITFIIFLNCGSGINKSEGKIIKLYGKITVNGEEVKTGKIVKSYPLPGRDQEGITLDRAGSIYLAQDSGGIIKFTWTSFER